MNEEQPNARSGATSRHWQREVAFAAGALAFGLLVLPPAIYFVGVRMLGDYEGGGLMGLSEAIWADLLSLRLPAWLLVLSPYLVLLLARAVRRAMRG